MILLFCHMLLYVLDAIFLDRVWKLIITLHDKIKYEKIPYDIIRESAKTSKLLSGKIDNNIFQEKKYYF